ncbi:hypothetical protein PCANC_06276 [Puccinia coronata f. sp. avenae]|uniref:Uncharacterized protein n=1 Tax=Puccinia coronata f. sp. avenae TaxID=200324 RepID=A0A2N5VRM8_9BASI|nr:hypothetical protein PCANC_10408 [Puccinia coronata f. sp. avenae]PLW52649.1 hypothetical protein PCANC_06276 [Puccinia coronata f. sp. avenae]
MFRTIATASTVDEIIYTSGRNLCIPLILDRSLPDDRVPPGLEMFDGGRRAPLGMPSLLCTSTLVRPVVGMRSEHFTPEQCCSGAGTHLNGEPVNRDRDRDRANASSNLDLFNFIYYCCPQSSSSYHTSPTAHRPPRAPHH